MIRSPRIKVMKGVDTLANAVKVTLGPGDGCRD
jgi:chaperonin GroEL (HSP60 family)